MGQGGRQHAGDGSRTRGDGAGGAPPVAEAGRDDRAPADLLQLQQAAGNRAVAAMLMRAPEGGTATAAPAGSGVTGTSPVDVSEKEDDLLARSIVDGELGILRQWRDALLMFDKTMVSESDESAKPDFQKAAVDYFADKVMSGIVSLGKVPGAELAFGAFQKMDEEFKRAKTAAESARLRDFFNTHLSAISALDRQLTLAKDDFEAAVEKTASKVGEGNDQANSDYGLMRLRLVELFEDVESRLAASDTAALFEILSTQWINASTVPIGMGHRADARVIIRLEEDYSLRNGHIQGGGGQKLAEQMLKNTPDGIDLYAMEVPRTIIRYAKNGWPKDILRLDEKGRQDNTGAFAEGNPDSLKRWIASNGLPKVTKVSGD